MGAIMNKRMMILLAGIISISPVVQIVASAESMYQDIVQNAINDSMKNPEYANTIQLYSIENALVQVNDLRQIAQSKLLRSYDFMNSGVMTYLRGLNGFLGGAAILAGINQYVRLNGKVEDVAMGLIVGTLGLSAYCADKIERYAVRKQIKQYNEVIAKLELKKTELKKKIKAENKKIMAKMMIRIEVQ